MKKKKSKLRSQMRMKEDARRSTAPPKVTPEELPQPARTLEVFASDPGTRDEDAKLASSKPEHTKEVAPLGVDSDAPSSTSSPPSSAPPSSDAQPEEEHEDSGLHHDFFSAPPPPRVPHGIGFEDELDSPKLRVFSAQARERRKKFVRHVTWVVAGCVGLVVVAGILHATRTEEAPPASVTSIASPSTPAGTSSEGHDLAPPASSGASAAAPPAAPSATSDVQDSAALGESGVDAGLVRDAGANAAGYSTEPAADAGAAALPGNAEDAVRERRSAKSALESGRLKDAVAAGERAVGLDATDAESWLYLGAAYQELGDQGNATRCYRACLARGTHGDKSECAAMLRQ